MNSKRHTIVSALKKQLRHDDSWLKKLSSNHFSLHLAIFREPYLKFIMEGKKKIETRFAKRSCAPFEQVSDGDVVLLKKSGGEVSGICEVEKVWFYHLDPEAFAFIKKQFGKLICAVNDSFWTERECKTVATLMLIKNVIPISGVQIKKRDRRGWVVLQAKQEPSSFK
jgi:ASC-1-like (ASCH) protein